MRKISKANVSVGLKSVETVTWIVWRLVVAIVPGCKEPYRDVNDVDDEVLSEAEDRALPLPSKVDFKLDKRLSLVKSFKGQNHPPDFDHTRWLFETKGTYGYGNALWPKDGYGLGSGANGFENPPDFGERSKRPLTRKVGVSTAILSPYRSVLSLRTFGIRKEDPTFRGSMFSFSTVDPEKEPPLVTANTILSILAVDYPVEKLACYLSDDGGALLTFEALAETASFARVWVPFCRKHNIEPRNPEAYFGQKRDFLKNKVRLDFVRREGG
ncbi:hypothetical protein V6N11_059681 [Hibiscus sabdariffa]|uniref:Uncharacterized protein n=1 Tax=Hibiscus sabdariffa TaxID=183260 RepID=A0ABR2NXW4_9ROSI